MNSSEFIERIGTASPNAVSAIIDTLRLSEMTIPELAQEFDVAMEKPIDPTLEVTSIPKVSFISDLILDKSIDVMNRKYFKGRAFSDRLDANFALGLRVDSRLPVLNELQSPYKEAFLKVVLARIIVGPRRAELLQPKLPVTKGSGNYQDEVLNTYI